MDVLWGSAAVSAGASGAAQAFAGDLVWQAYEHSQYRKGKSMSILSYRDSIHQYTSFVSGLEFPSGKQPGSLFE